MSFSDEEITAILANWDAVCADKKAAGLAIFCKLLEENPDIHQMFKAFKDKTVEEVRESPQGRVHGLRVVNALDQVIRALPTNPEESVAGLKMIGESHGPRNVKKEHFEKLNEVIDAVLDDALKDAYAKDAWKKLLDFTIPILAEGVESTSV